MLDQVTDGPKPELVARLGGDLPRARRVGARARPTSSSSATGAPAVVADALRGTAPGGIVCLTGVSSGGGRSIRRRRPQPRLVLENDVVFGTVNANRRHYEAAATASGEADRDWLRALITRRVPLDRWQEALERKPDDVKVVVELS